MRSMFKGLQGISLAGKAAAAAASAATAAAVEAPAAKPSPTCITHNYLEHTKYYGTISSFLSISINLIDEWTISINFINMSERSPKDLYGKHKGKVNDDTPAKRTRVQDQDSGLLPDNTLPGGSPTPVLVPTPDPIESVQESGILNYRVKIIIFYVF